nr:cytochrome C oxidase subunit IV family protein [uncultured Shimia sp.]
MCTQVLLRAWLFLIGLSAASALVAHELSDVLDRRLVGMLILLLAFAKSRVILKWYLGLSQAPSWRRGFQVVLGLYCCVLFGFYLL